MGQSYAMPSKGGAAPEKAQSTQGTALAARGQQLPQKAGNQGVGGTLKGWWDKGTDWLGKKYDQASGAVSGAYNSVKQTATDFADIYQNSDLSYKDGKFSASTDMDEVMDVLPASMREKLSLDKSLPSANKATLEVDTNTGKLSLKVPNLMLSSLNMGGVSAGKTRLGGVQLTIDNAGALAHDYAKKKAGSTVADMVFGKQQQATGIDNTTTLKVASVLANDVAYPAAQMSAKQLELSALDVSIFNKGGGLPGADAHPDQLQMNFSVGSAVVRGLSSPKSSATELGISGLSGNLDQIRETGDVAAGRIHASGLVHDGNRLGSGQISDLRSHIDNKGGGLPFLDAQQDQLQTSGSVGALALQGLDSSKAKAGSATVEGLGWQQGQNTSITAKKAHVENGSSALGSVKSGDLNGVRAQVGGGGVTAGLDEGTLTGLDTKDIDASSLSVKNLDYQQGSAGKKLSLAGAQAKGLDAGGQTLGSAEVQGLIATEGQDGRRSGSLVGATLNNLDSAQVDAKQAVISGLQYSQDRNGLAVDVQSAKANGLDVAGNKVAAAQISGLSATQKGEDFSAHLGGGSATGIDTASVDAGRATIQELRLQKNGSGIQGSAAGISAEKLTGDGISVGNLSAQAVSGQSGAAGLSGSVGKASIDALDSQSVDVGHGNLTGLNFHKDGQGTSGSVDSLAAQKLSAGGTTVGTVAAQKLAAQTTAGGASGSAAGVQLQNLKSGTATVGSADLSGLSGAKEGEKVSVGLEKGQATGVGVAGATVGKIGVEKLAASGDQATQSGRLSLGSLDAEKLHHAAGSAQSLGLKGLTVAGSNSGGGRAVVDQKPDRLQGSMSLDQGTVSGLDTKGFDARSVELRGAQAAVNGDQKSGSLASVTASGVAADAGGMKVGVEKIQGTNLSGKTTAGGKATAAPTGPSPAALAGLVDEAHLKGSVALNPGKAGPVKIGANTNANFNVDVQNGRIDPRSTRVAVDKPLDGPLWVTAKGAYLDDQGGDRAKLKADLGGWKDMNLSDQLPGKQDTVPLKLSELAQQVLPTTGKSPAAKPVTSGPGLEGKAGSLSASGITLNGTLPADKGGKASGPVDLDRSNLAGTVGLRSGKADLGSVKADLQREDSRDNTASVSANGASNLALQFTRLLVGNFSVDTGDSALKGGKSSISGGALSVQEGKGGQQVKGSIGAVKVENLEGAKR